MIEESVANAAYQRFVETPDGAHKDLGAEDIALLDAVLAAAGSGAPMTVIAAISLVHLGSRATLHKRLQRLRGAEYLAVQTHAVDGRVKFLLPAHRGRQYAQAVGRRIIAAAAGAASSCGAATEQPWPAGALAINASYMGQYPSSVEACHAR
jgi:hypothetical protein